MAISGLASATLIPWLFLPESEKENPIKAPLLLWERGGGEGRQTNAVVCSTVCSPENRSRLYGCTPNQGVPLPLTPEISVNLMMLSYLYPSKIVDCLHLAGDLP